jgi:hypothetical protein
VNVNNEDGRKSGREIRLRSTELGIFWACLNFEKRRRKPHKQKKMEGCWKLMGVAVLCIYWLPIWGFAAEQQLRFGKSGEFKILQVADMHYADGKTTPCEDVLPRQVASCSDLNTTAFVRRMILAEKPHLIVFTGTLLVFLLFMLLPFTSNIASGHFFTMYRTALNPMTVS